MLFTAKVAKEAILQKSACTFTPKCRYFCERDAREMEASPAGKNGRTAA
jgi:hypothetical protein